MRSRQLLGLVPFLGTVACADLSGPGGAVEVAVTTQGVIPDVQFCVSVEVREATLEEVTFSDGSRGHAGRGQWIRKSAGQTQ
jgi:hypothetical protein